MFLEPQLGNHLLISILQSIGYHQCFTEQVLQVEAHISQLRKCPYHILTPSPQSGRRELDRDSINSN